MKDKITCLFLCGIGVYYGGKAWGESTSFAVFLGITAIWYAILSLQKK